MAKLTKAQRATLACVKAYDDETGWLARHDTIATRLDIPLRSAKLHARRLQRAGLLKRVAAFSDQDGLLVGSGLCVTAAGRAALRETDHADA